MKTTCLICKGSGKLPVRQQPKAESHGEEMIGEGGGTGFVVPDVFDDDGIIGNWGNGDLTACPYTLIRVLEIIIPNIVRIIAAALANFNWLI
jgi:hypothetical protein